MTRAVIFDMFETLITHYKSPLYFGAQMAKDIGITETEFRKIWTPTEHDRSIGKITFKEVITYILKENDCYSEVLLKTITDKRVAAKEECFRQLHSEIIPMLAGLKEKGYLIGLISNCFSEETKVIRESVLFPYFDAPYLSYEQGVAKPDEEIFKRCMKELGVTAGECVYVGDGGSYELETASRLGMKAVQATWYLQEGTTQPVGRKPEFLQADKPMDILNYLER